MLKEINLIYLLLLNFNFNFISSRIHHLSLKDDYRDQFTITTFGYLRKGYLQININELSFIKCAPYLNIIKDSFAFNLEKTTSGGFSNTQENRYKNNVCSLIKESMNNPNGTQIVPHLDDRTSMIVFKLNIKNKRVEIVKNGLNVQGIQISHKFKHSVENIEEKMSQNTTIDNSQDRYNDNLDSYLPINATDDTSISLKFEVSFDEQRQEGLYEFRFYNCFKSLLAKEQFNSECPIDLTFELIEKNEDSYLSAGEMPVPTLYLTWAILYFLAGVSWVFILKTSKGDVFKIHYLMLSLVVIKSMSLTFHAINLHYIALNGKHEAVWAILFYITYVLRGLLMITAILLVGTGFNFVKHILSDNERRLFALVVPLQILAIIAYIFLEEKEESEVVYVTWRQLFFLLDLICCGAILLPIVWSIKHLESAQRTDGKAAISLKKLKLFKQFYIMVICYIYFTRIIGYLLKLIVPFRYEWLDKLCTELVTFLFFALTAYKFQPQANNPYLQLSTDELSIDYEAEMNEVALNAASVDSSNVSSRKSKQEQQV